MYELLCALKGLEKSDKVLEKLWKSPGVLFLHGSMNLDTP